MIIRCKIFFVIAALLPLIAAYAGVEDNFFQDLAAAKNQQSSQDKNVRLDILPVNIHAAQQNGVQYFETNDSFIKQADPLHVGYNQTKGFFINVLPQNCTPAGIEFKKPEDFGLPGLQFKNGANADVFQANTYESDDFIITSYFPLEYNFADRKFTAGGADSGANAVINNSANTVLCENFTPQSRKIILTYKNGTLSPLINRIDSANPSRLLQEILAREQMFKNKMQSVIQGGKIIVAYKIFNKLLRTTTITLYVLK
ncbi:MAG: hypothetical protein LBI01_07020 [Elusimicrobium sp.]|jgi:hypothetical protein|nr:hypothetical protein [Elusimicrobium sp.]